ncbi:hypothetical protein SKAU_G00408520 [Synaphobranchus kaupii]|uniref:Sema domain-containing protein n=1 Tax=Synaphobranchus kaupii TaxID=118154 RepID=A0A9Q1EAG1_SYNKA|nr:hypothetical protein SKAU_G00408520 [Synaphobranchus kaupii]
MALWKLAWVVMVILPACLGQLVPRVSFATGSPGRSLTIFDSPDVRNTTTLLLSKDAETLFVGSRDAVLSLDVSEPGVMEMKRKVDWFPSPKDLDDCSMKGKKRTDCHNFRVLQFLNSTHMYACGTFAFSPSCTYIDSQTFTTVNGPTGKPDEGRGRCPYDPYQRNTAITVDGELYTGTVADYRGNRPVISRYLSEGGHVDMKLDDTLGWLEDPTFISAAFIPGHEKVYFFFSEEGREYDFIEKFTVSRIAQVCTSDVGGQRTLQRRWTTFSKAQLLCQAENELPYNVLQDIVTLPPPEGATDDETLFYGIFRSQWSVNSGKSAVCAFRLGDVKKVFSGNYKVLNRDTLRWSTRLQEKGANPGECGLHNASDSALRFVKENFLADENVLPVKRGLALVSPDQRYSKIAAQMTRGANGRDYTVLYLLSETGFLHKVVLLEQGPHIIEEVQVFQQPQPMNNLLLSITKGVVFVGTSDGVVQVPVSNCSYYWSCAECVLSRDPFCAWDPVSKACAQVSSIPADAAQDLEGVGVAEQCKVINITPKAKFGQPRTPTGEQVLVSLNEVVTLRCPEASNLASLHWERADGQLSPDLYLHQPDGSLRFLATPDTLGRYLCFSVESSYRQNLALYAVRDVGGGATATPATVAPPQPMAETTAKWEGPAPREEAEPNNAAPNPTADWRTVTAPPRVTRIPTVTKQPRVTPGLERQGPREGRSYYEELVAVSIMLALALCVLLAGALYGLRQRYRGKSGPQVCPGRDSEAGSLREQDPLTRNPAQNAAAAAATTKQNGLAQNGLLQSKPPATVKNGSPRGSNGHLPNTPI